MILYKTGSDFSGDLKRYAHAVRQAVDVKPITSDPITGEVHHPRRRRQVGWDVERRWPRRDPHIPRAVRVAVSRGR